MHDDDRAKYGGPEWLDISAAVEALNDLDWDTQNAFDEQVYQQTGEGLILSIGQLRTWKLTAQRVGMWLGLWHAGVVIPFADFKPTKPLRFRVEGNDAVPPASTPGSSDTSISATTPEPETSSSASTPGSRARTSSSRAKSAR